MFVQRFFAACFALWCFASTAQAELKEYTFSSADGYDSNTGMLLKGPGGVSFVGFPPETKQFQQCLIDLKRTFSRGRYKIQYTLFSPGEGAPAVALYALGAGGRDMDAAYTRSVAPGGTGSFTAYFYAKLPFSAMMIKKMEDKAKPSQGIGEFRLTDLQQREYPRLESYWTLMQYPAAWGLRSPVIQEKLNKAKEAVSENFDAVWSELAEVERWLDLRSEAAELFGTADELLRVAALKKVSAVQAQVEAVQKDEKTLKNALAMNRLGEADANLKTFHQSVDALQASLEKSLGGIVRPEVGTDIFTWLKAWSLIGAEGSFEYSEPTPFQTDTLPLGRAIDSFSTWTTNTYRGNGLTVRYSVLTPMRTIDTDGGTIRLRLAGEKFQPVELDQAYSKGFFALKSDKNLLLFVLNRKPAKVNWANSELTIDLPNGGALGYVRKEASQAQLEKLAEFYHRLLLKQPVECVQIQKGNAIEQTFEYVERPCDWPVKPMTIAPIPQLAMLSLEPSSHYHVKITQPILRAPDGWGYVNQSDALQYEIPEVKRWNAFGINNSRTVARPEHYEELQKQGCQVVRLLCGAEPDDEWREDRLDELKKGLQENLQWARQVGLKVGVETHGNGWIPANLEGETGFSDPEKLAEFIAHWKQIIEWCKPYQDVVAWYDLKNEPQIAYEHGSVKPYAVFMRKAVAALRPTAGDTPILVECVNDGNPVGLQFWEDLGDDNIIVGYHDYWPHMFTHQRVVEPGDQAMPAVFYPSWMPMIEWQTPSWNNHSPNWHYWDRWKCDSISLPVYRLLITKGFRLDCGEYGIVGYAGDSSPRSGVIWLRHAMERFRRMGISHNVYGYTGGFTWNTPVFKDEVLRIWRQWGEEESKRSPVKAESQ